MCHLGGAGLVSYLVLHACASVQRGTYQEAQLLLGVTFQTPNKINVCWVKAILFFRPSDWVSADPVNCPGAVSLLKQQCALALQFVFNIAYPDGFFPRLPKDFMTICYSVCSCWAIETDIQAWGRFLWRKLPFIADFLFFFLIAYLVL